MQKNAISLQYQIMGFAHLQRLYGKLKFGVASKDVHKHDKDYLAIRADFRRALKSHVDYQEGVTFYKHTVPAQGRIIESMQSFAEKQNWAWHNDAKCVKALVQSMCMGSSTTARQRINVRAAEDLATNASVNNQDMADIHDVSVAVRQDYNATMNCLSLAGTRLNFRGHRGRQRIDIRHKRCANHTSQPNC